MGLLAGYRPDLDSLVGYRIDFIIADARRHEEKRILDFCEVVNRSGGCRAGGRREVDRLQPEPARRARWQRVAERFPLPGGEIAAEPRLMLAVVQVERIRQTLDLHKTMLEIGAGGSTCYFAPHVGRLHSIEHSLEWAGRLRRCLPSNVTLHVVPPDRVLRERGLARRAAAGA